MSLPSRRPRAAGLVPILALVPALVLAGCGGASPSSSASASGSAAPTLAGSATPGPEARWDQARVELPAIVMAQASGAPLGQQCSPCHQSQVDLMLGVAPMPGGYVAVGIQEPPAIAVAWRSTTGSTWSPIATFPALAGSEANAAVAAHGRIVVVGGGPDGAAAWTSSDTGASWSTAPTTADLARPHGTARMTSIVAWDGGFVSGGYQDILATGRSLAEIWTSADGLDWHRVSDTGPAFSGAHIFGLATDGKRLVAVGTTGDQFRGPAGVWTSTDGQRWTVVTSSAFTAGAMAGVAAGGPGFVAVGSGAND